MTASPTSTRSAELITITSVLLFSIISFGLGVEYARQAATSPVDIHGEYASSLDPSPSTARIVFYSVTMPFLSTIYSAFHIVFSTRFPPSSLLLRPVPALVTSILLLCGWTIQTAMWMECTVNAENDVGICFQPKLVSKSDGGAPRFVNGRIHDALLSFGWVGMVVSGVLVVLQGMRVRRQRMTRKRPVVADVKGLETGSSRS